MTLNYQTDVKIFKAFAEENRLMILMLLQSGEKCACTLEESLPISQSTLSHHMRILVDSGVVKVRKDKKWSYYALSEIGIHTALDKLKTLLTVTAETLNTCDCIGEEEELYENHEEN